MNWNYRRKISATVLTNLIQNTPTFDKPKDCSELPFFNKIRKIAKVIEKCQVNVWLSQSYKSLKTNNVKFYGFPQVSNSKQSTTIHESLAEES